jgi:hypothetical protein
MQESKTAPPLLACPELRASIPSTASKSAAREPITAAEAKCPVPNNHPAPIATKTEKIVTPLGETPQLSKIFETG